LLYMCLLYMCCCTTGKAKPQLPLSLIWPLPNPRPYLCPLVT